MRRRSFVHCGGKRCRRRVLEIFVACLRGAPPCSLTIVPVLSSAVFPSLMTYSAISSAQIPAAATASLLFSLFKRTINALKVSPHARHPSRILRSRIYKCRSLRASAAQSRQGLLTFSFPSLFFFFVILAFSHVLFHFSAKRPGASLISILKGSHLAREEKARLALSPEAVMHYE